MVEAGQDNGFAAGNSFGVRGFVHRQITDDPQRDYLHLAFVGSDHEVTCAEYGVFLDRVADAQAWAETLLQDTNNTPPDGWDLALCQQIRGAATEAFGSPGRYRALHALLDVTGGGPQSGIFRAAPPGIDERPFLGGDLLSAGQYATRLYERYTHGAGLLPARTPTGWEGGDPDPIDQCDGFARRLLEERLDGRTTYPDRASLALQAGNHRYYHLHKDQDSVNFGTAGDLEVGFVFPDWAIAATTGASVVPTVWGAVARAPSNFPYEEVLMSSEGRPVEVTPCPSLGDHSSLVWPEVSAFGALPMGDDDDSAR